MGELDGYKLKKKKKKLEHSLTPYPKINSDGSKDLNVSLDPIKFKGKQAGH